MQVKRISPNKNNRSNLRFEPARLNGDKSLDDEAMRKLDERLRQLFQQDQQIASTSPVIARPRLGKAKVIRRRRGQTDKCISS